ncbi:MAG: C45 family peptidase [Myxococcaceae bacterium]
MVRFLLFGFVLVPAAGLAGGSVVQQSLNGTRAGYTVMKVWGTPAEMGFSQGSLLAEDICNSVSDVKTLAGAQYAALRGQIALTRWKPAEVEEELAGMVDGIKSVRPAETIDVLDLKVVNTYGDWAYACRSHSTWGSFVTAPTRTLSTRRLDFPSVGRLMQNHVLIARQPQGTGIRWVNLASPGAVVSVTGVNEFGTLASLHDYQTVAQWGAYLPRSLLPRFALTLPAGLPISGHLDAVYTALQAEAVMTGTFLNYYVPEGHGGVITCPRAGACNKKRVPQADYFGGEVLLTTNAETDGHAAPPDDNFMGPYYAAGKPKALAGHYALMGHGGLHLLSVDYRGRGDMTLWFEGRVGSGTTPTVKVEWSDLFTAEVADGGTASDAGTDAGTVTDGGSDAGPGPIAQATDGGISGPPPKPLPGCGCGATGNPGVLLVAAALLLLVAGRRRGAYTEGVQPGDSPDF